MPDTLGKETHLSYLPRDQNSHGCRVGPPIDSTLGRVPACHQGCQDTYQETQRAGVHNPQGYNWGRLQATAETAQLHVAECCSLPHWSSLAISHQRLCSTGLRAYPLQPMRPTRLALPCNTPTYPFPTVLSLRPTGSDSGTWVHIPYCLLCACYILPRLL